MIWSKGAVLMPSTSVTIRMDSDLKKTVESLFEEMGLNMTTAITMFAKTVARQKKIPFEISAEQTKPANQRKPEISLDEITGPPHLDISNMKRNR
jgi:DNA-damage-inducible protein J